MQEGVRGECFNVPGDLPAREPEIFDGQTFDDASELDLEGDQWPNEYSDSRYFDAPFEGDEICDQPDGLAASESSSNIPEQPIDQYQDPEEVSPEEPDEAREMPAMVPFKDFRETLPERSPADIRDVDFGPDITRACALAPRVEAERGAPLTLSPDGSTNLSALDEAGDDELVPVNMTIRPEPNVVYVRTLDELRELEIQASLMIDGKDAVDIAHINADVTHEGEHARVIEADENASTIYGFRIAKVHYSGEPNDVLYWGSQAFHTYSGFLSKPQLVFYIAHPEKPSDGDRQDLHRLGYNSIEEVGAYLEVHNATHDKKIPLPLSYTPARKNGV